MLANIPETILHDMDNLLETRDKDTSGRKMAAIADFLNDASDFFAEQRQRIADPSMRHNATILSQGFSSGKLIVEHASKNT